MPAMPSARRFRLRTSSPTSRPIGRHWPRSRADGGDAFRVPASLDGARRSRRCPGCKRLRGWAISHRYPAFRRFLWTRSPNEAAMIDASPPADPRRGDAVFDAAGRRCRRSGSSTLTRPPRRGRDGAGRRIDPAGSGRLQGVGHHVGPVRRAGDPPGLSDLARELQREAARLARQRGDHAEAAGGHRSALALLRARELERPSRGPPAGGPRDRRVRGGARNGAALPERRRRRARSSSSAERPRAST